jgi:uncharacterized membrane protein YqjE
MLGDKDKIVWEIIPMVTVLSSLVVGMVVVRIEALEMELPEEEPRILELEEMLWQIEL